MTDALAGEAAGSTTNLEAIARHYCGEFVRVQWSVMPSLCGLATRNEDSALIFLHPGLPLGRLGAVFFHECGHIALGHITGKSPSVDPVAMAQSLAERNERIEAAAPADKQFFNTFIGTLEEEADAFSAEALADFERRFGPFLAALGIGEVLSFADKCLKEIAPEYIFSQ